MGEVVRTLKDRLAAEARTGAPVAPSMTVVPYGTKPGESKPVGSGGAWSVENRYPVPGTSAGNAGASRPGPLSRAGQAVRRAAGGSWAAVVVVCAIAGALVVALLVRRGRATT